jgi:hypothetical protein
MTAQSLHPADRLPSEIAHLLRPELPPLGPGRPQQALAGSLQEADPNGWKRRAGALSADAAACCMAGLWLWNGFLEDSHSLSQSIHTPEGSWWHGIMHRREPDPGNASYWFRRVGDHPLAGPLADGVRAQLAGRDVPVAASWLQTADRWDAFRFIDLCEQARGRGGLLEQLIREVAAIEWYVLFDFCRDADDPYSFTRSK